MTFRVTYTYTRPSDSVAFFESVSAEAQSVISSAQSDGRITDTNESSSGNTRTVTIDYRDEAARDSIRLEAAIVSHTEARDAYCAENSIQLDVAEQTV